MLAAPDVQQPFSRRNDVPKTQAVRQGLAKRSTSDEHSCLDVQLAHTLRDATQTIQAVMQRHAELVEHCWGRY